MEIKQIFLYFNHFHLVHFLLLQFSTSLSAILVYGVRSTNFVLIRRVPFCTYFNKMSSILMPLNGVHF